MDEPLENKHPLNKIAAEALEKMGTMPDPARLYALDLAKTGLEQGLAENPQMAELRRPLIYLIDHLQTLDLPAVNAKVVGTMENLEFALLKELSPNELSEEMIDAVVSLAIGMRWTPETELEALVI